MSSNLDLAVIGNCQIGALIDRRARIVWSCFPKLDGDPIFCQLLDNDGVNEDSGIFEIAVDGFESSTRSYVGNTAILATTLRTRSGGSVRVTDFAPRFKHYGRIFRPAMLVRRIEPVGGQCRIRVKLRPRFNYGAARPRVVTGSNNLRFVGEDMTLRLTTDAPLSYIAAEAWFMLTSPLNFMLGADETVTDSVPNLVRDFADRTEEYWVEWCRYLSVPFEWQDAVIRAAIALKLCSFEDTGAVLAALTTSIPEAPGTSRNWDYRFCWLRDSYFTVHALNRLGATRTMEDYIEYITNVAALHVADSNLRPVYGLIPGPTLEERQVDSLAGYRGMGPVRVGNAADLQVQHDSYGSVIVAAAQMFFDRRLRKPGDADLFRLLERLGERAARVVLEPDAGIWEYRGRLLPHTYSSVMCWAACDRLAKIAAVLGLTDRAEHWRANARRIRELVKTRAWNAELNSFVSDVGGDTIDASLLLLHELGFVSANDPRFLGTIAAVEKQLKRGDYLFRYVTPDDFGTPTTAFTVCTFWYIDALVAVGRRDEAREVFERVLTWRNDVGLLSEDIDPATGELWGNYPQTYSLVGLIVSAMRLSRGWEEAFWRGS